MNDDDDLGSTLFGTGDPSLDGSFDPFEPRFGEEGNEASEDVGENYRLDGDTDSAIIYQYADAIGGLDGHGSESASGLQQDNSGPLPWQGEGDIGILGAQERREREAADTGDRNVRRTADKHTGSIGPGGTARNHSANVDSSIDAAAERIRADLRVPLDPRERSAAVVKWEQGGDKNRKIKREYHKQGITAPPQFMSTSFPATLAGLKANANGIWVLTLNIDPMAGNLVFPLNSAFGLALDVKIDRHSWRPDNDVHT